MTESCVKKKHRLPYLLKRGETIYMNTGELSFETCPQEAGTFPVTFLEWVYRDDDPEEGDPDGVVRTYYGRVINHKGRVQNVHSSLLNRFNI